MVDNYLAFWKINKPPFSLTPDPDMLYLSNQHSECLMRLKYAIFSQKGGALLVSDNAGNGKTSVLEKLKKDLDEYYAGRVKVVFIDHPTISSIEMIGEIAYQLGEDHHATEKIKALNYLRDRLFSLYNENVKVVVIVDEGQMLKDRADILGELRILLNFCVSDAFLLTFIFSGQKPLDSMLREMPEFWQRLPVRYFLRNLDFKDTCALIKFRLEKVGCSEDIFKDDAFEGIYRYSEGCPRIICSVADLCLVIGYAKGVKRVGFVEVSTACRDMETSGDSFHYYAYIKSQYHANKSSSGPKKSSIDKPVPSSDLRNVSDKKQSITNKKQVVTDEKQNVSDNQPAAIPRVVTVSCPSCAKANPGDRKFCAECGHPLYRKCPQCRTLIDTVSDECPVCNVNIVVAKRSVLETVELDLQRFNIIENGSKIWLEASGITLDGDERLLIIFPRGNAITPGPRILVNNKEGKSSREACDIVMTDKRLLLVIGDDLVSTDLMHIETCMVSNTGSIIGNRYVQIIGFKGNIYTIFFPYRSRKTKKILDSISSFVQMEMLQ